MRVAAVLVAALAAVAQGFVVPSAAPATRTRGVMSMLKVSQPSISERDDACVESSGNRIWKERGCACLGDAERSEHALDVEGLWIGLGCEVIDPTNK